MQPRSARNSFVIFVRDSGIAVFTADSMNALLQRDGMLQDCSASILSNSFSFEALSCAALLPARSGTAAFATRPPAWTFDNHKHPEDERAAWSLHGGGSSRIACAMEKGKPFLSRHRAQRAFNTSTLTRQYLKMHIVPHD